MKHENANTNNCHTNRHVVDGNGAEGSGRRVPAYMAPFTGEPGNPYAMDLPPEVVKELPWVSFCDCVCVFVCFCVAIAYRQCRLFVQIDDPSDVWKQWHVNSKACVQVLILHA